MPAIVLFLECKSYVIVGIFAIIWISVDVRFSGRPSPFARDL